MVSIPTTTWFTHPTSMYRTSMLLGKVTLPCTHKIPLNEISRRSISLSDAMAGLPDLVDDLERLSLPTILRRCRYQLAFEHPTNLELVKDTDSSIIDSHDLLVYGVSADDEASLQTYYEGIQSRHVPFGRVENGTVRALLSHNVTKSDVLKIYTPDLIDASSAELYFVLKPKEYLPEPAAILMVLYVLGMLCRYYPDVWIKMIDGSVTFSETISSVLRTVRRRFPNLILNQARQEKYVFQK